MKKPTIYWIAIFCASIFTLAILFSYYQVKDQFKQPSEKWSRGMLISEVDKSEVSDSTNVRVATVEIKDQNLFITFWNDKNALNYASYDKHGKRLKRGKLPLKLDEPVMLKAIYSEADKKIILYSQENKRLDRYFFDYPSESIRFAGTAATGVSAIQQSHTDLYLATATGIVRVAPSGVPTILTTRETDAVDVFEDIQNVIHMTYLTTDDTGMKHLYYTNGANDTFQNPVYEIGQIMISPGEFDAIDNLIIGQTGEKMNIIVPLQCYSQQNGRVIIYSFDKNSPQKVDVNESDVFYQYNPNPVSVLKDGTTIDFLITMPVTLGNKTKTINIMKYSLTANGLKQDEQLTKLKAFSVNPTYFELGGAAYIQWENRLPESTKIMFASTDSEIVKAANEFNLSEFLEALFNSLLAMLFSLASAFLICPAILIPAVLIIGTLAILFFDWVENNPDKVTLGIVVVHTISVFVFTLFLFRHNTHFMGLAPVYLQNGIVLYALILALCVIPYLCMRIRFKNKKMDSTFLYQYSFFVMLNFILYSLLIFPWGFI